MRILVVYDEDRTRGFIVSTLGAAHEVLETQSADTALDLLALSGHCCDVVVLTCLARQQRPDYSRHVEFVRTMFQRWPWVPVILLTRPQEAARLTGALLLSGAQEVMAKPFAARALIAAVGRLAPRSGKAQRLPAAAVTAMRRVLTFLGDHAGDSPTLGELATMAAMSRSHFSHTFHAVIGMPLRDYVRDLRLKHAHQLLLVSTLPIGAIATETGFYDQPHFDKAFRHCFGMSPRAYRLQYGRGSPAHAGPPRRRGQRT